MKIAYKIPDKYIELFSHMAEVLKHPSVQSYIDLEISGFLYDLAKSNAEIYGFNKETFIRDDKGFDIDIE